MSMRLSTRYTEVQRSAASASMAVPGCKKCVTSAMCTPITHGGGVAEIGSPQKENVITMGLSSL
eukprot:764678-Prorocentrum_minimum.AAC.1